MADPRGTRRWRQIRAAILASATHCADCGDELDFTAPPRSPRSPSVDHNRALARAGQALDPRNLRAVHYGCNASKGANDW